jgi:hypothetical protein
MLNEKRVFRFVASLIFLFCASFSFGLYASAQQSSSSIVGRWRSLETSRGRLGAMYEFRSDGTIDLSYGAIVESPWRIENNQLVLPPATVDGDEQKFTLQWLSDSKLKLKTEASVTELTRVGDRSHADQPLVGEWIEHREEAGHDWEAHWLFYPNSKALLLIPFKIQHASYTISGSVIHLKLAGIRSENTFEVKDNVLTFSDPEGGHEDRYARY